MDGEWEEEIRGLSPEEFAVLDFTSPSWERGDENGFGVVFLSTKSSYLWGTTLETIYSKRPDVAPGQVFRWSKETFREFAAGALSSSPRYPDHPANFTDVAAPFIQKADLPKETVLSEAMESLEAAYADLREKNLIEDPAVLSIAGAGVAVLGVCPYNFTKRTQQGELVYRRISALLWEYEYESDGEMEETQLNLKLLKLLRAFKSGAVEAYEQEIE